MKLLRTILQSNKTYVIILLILIIYVVINTLFIEHKSIYSGSETKIVGVVKKVNKKKDVTVFYIKSKEDIIAKYYIKKESPKIDNIIGSKIILIGELKKTSNNTIPNTFNYKKYLSHNKIYYTFIINKFSYSASINFIYKIKNYLYERVDRINKSNTYLNLFILGNISMLDNDLYNTYLNNGVSHLFAISGLHIGFLILFLSKILKFKYKNILIVLSLWFYAFIVSFSISILRAIIFYTISSLFKFLHIKIDNKKVLYLTAFILLLINPFSIFDVGFLYSFVTVFALLKCNSYIKGNYFIKLIIISIITLLYSLPITINLNYEINVLSIINNIIFIPLVTFVIYPLSILTFIFPILNNIYLFVITIMESINNILSNINFLKIVIPKIPIIIVIIYYLILIMNINIKKKLLIISLIMLLLKISVYLDCNNYVYYLDVGQGDCTLIISSRRKEIVMIDTGGDIIPKSYHKSDNVIKFIKSLGISKIDLMILSHGDGDHVGEALNINKKLEVKNVIINKNHINNYEKLIVENMNVVKDYHSKAIIINNYNLYINDDENYSSIITSITMNKNSFLFMGDLPKENEIKFIHDRNITSDYLKLGHHGSKTSSDIRFLKHINPKYAIISSSKNNLYHHPSKETLDNLNMLKIKYLNTSETGTIEIKINDGSSTLIKYEP